MIMTVVIQELTLAGQAIMICRHGGPLRSALADLRLGLL